MIVKMQVWAKGNSAPVFERELYVEYVEEADRCASIYDAYLHYEYPDYYYFSMVLLDSNGDIVKVYEDTL